MKRTQLKLRSFAKINLSLDVVGLLDNGFHQVDMVMQQILLCDDIVIKWHPDAAVGAAAGQTGSGVTIEVSTNRYFLPTDERNLAYRAAALMAERYGAELPGGISIDIKKRIPVAAGLAGGSGNAAAVLHGLNVLWDLGLSLKELSALGSQLGSDVPFCIMGQAAADEELKPLFQGDPLACHCALATGTGTDLRPLKNGLRSHLVLSKPPLSVSTAMVYRGIDSMTIDHRPDNDELIRGLEIGSMKLVRKNMINVLENFTLTQYPIVNETKEKLRKLCGADRVLMSGSGPSVFGLCRNIHQSKQICGEMKKLNKESFWTRTTW